MKENCASTDSASLDSASSNCAFFGSGRSSLRRSQKVVFPLFRTTSKFRYWSVRCHAPQISSPCITILKYVENIKELTKKLYHSDVALVFLWANVGQEFGRNHFLNTIHCPGSEDRCTIFILKCSAEVSYDIHYRDNKHCIATENTGFYIRKATHLESLRFCDWAAVISSDAPHQQRSLTPWKICRILRVMQRSKPMSPIQKNRKRCFIENARDARRSTFTCLRTGYCDGGWGGAGGTGDKECFSREIKPIRTEDLNKE